MTSLLFSPIRLGGLELANRLVVAPMCQYSADDGCVGDWHLTHLGMLANSGAGLLVVEATAVERAGRISHGCVGLYSDACEAALAKAVAHCRRIGAAKLGIQIGHAGRKASTQRPWEGGGPLAETESPWPVVAPSAMAFAPTWQVPREMTGDDMARVREAFVQAARRAVRIGFDCVELHMAHGYLLHSFTSPVANRRSDAYGGTLENRIRFPLEIARAVSDALPPGMPLGARISGFDWMDGGMTTDDAVGLAKGLKEAGVGFVCVSSGGIAPAARITLGPGYQVPFAEKVRRETGLPTRAVGLIAAPQQAETILAEGKADMIALARAFLDDPHWGWHAAQALGAEVVRPPQYARAAPAQWPGAAYSGR